MRRKKPVKSNKTAGSLERRTLDAEIVGPPTRATMVSVTKTTTEMVRRSGPLPPPQDLAAYDAALPGSAERIVQMAERQQAHRHVIELTDLTEGVQYAKRGQMMAFSLALIFSAIATVFAFKGLVELAAGIFFFVIVGLSATFLMSRREDKSAAGAIAARPQQPPAKR